jgi:hypothetical protein
MKPTSLSRARRGHEMSRCRRRATRVVAVITVTSAAVLAAACSDAPAPAGSDGASTGAASATAASAVRYATCMRSHGVPDYPDPNGSGQLPKITPANETQLGVSASRFNAAQAACQRLWPYQGLSQVQQHQELADALTFARCMRSHGVPNFPDPTANPASGRVQFVISGSSGIDLNSPQTLDKARTCEHGLPAYMLPGSPDGVEVTTSSGGGS